MYILRRFSLKYVVVLYGCPKESSGAHGDRETVAAVGRLPVLMAKAVT